MKTDNLPEPEVNKECQYRESNCLVRLPCIFCAYHEMVQAGNLFFKKAFEAKSIRRFGIPQGTKLETKVDAPTDKQVAYLTSLAEKQMGPLAETFIAEQIQGGRQTVSRAINDLLEISKKQSEEVSPVKPGTYRKKDGTLVKVVISKSTGKPYGKVLDTTTGKWEYEPGALNGLF